MSQATLAEAVAKLERLSEESAGRVVSLIDDLAKIEALEDAADLNAAHDALAAGDPDQWPTLADVEKRLLL